MFISKKNLVVMLLILAGLNTSCSSKLESNVASVSNSSNKVIHEVSQPETTVIPLIENPDENNHTTPDEVPRPSEPIIEEVSIQPLPAEAQIVEALPVQEILEELKPVITYSLLNSWPNQVKRSLAKEQSLNLKRPLKLTTCKDLTTLSNEFGCTLFSGTVPAADAKIYFADPVKKTLDKVAFILAPHNFENPQTINAEAKYTALLANADKVYNKLQAQGVSIIFVGYGHKNYYLNNLQTKANATEKIITLVNKLKSKPSQSLLMGLSLGGVIGRMTLINLERQSIDHQVSHYVSFDSPHRGAHVSLSMQHLMKFLKDSSSHAAKEVRNFRKYFGDFIDDILNLNDLSDQLDEGIAAGELVSKQVELFGDVFLNSQFAKELIIQQINSTNYLNRDYEFTQNHLHNMQMPKNTLKNIGITNGSISGRTLPLSGNYYIGLNSPRKNYTQIKFKTYIAKSSTSQLFSGVLSYPDPSELGGLFGGNGSDSYTYNRNINNKILDLDRGACGYLNAVGDIEKVIADIVKSAFNTTLDIQNRKMCFIPLASGLALNTHIAYKGRVTAQQSMFDEIIGGTENTHHLQHTKVIVDGVLKIVEETYSNTF